MISPSESSIMFYINILRAYKKGGCLTVNGFVFTTCMLQECKMLHYLFVYFCKMISVNIDFIQSCLLSKEPGNPSALVGLQELPGLVLVGFPCSYYAQRC